MFLLAGRAFERARRLRRRIVDLAENPAIALRPTGFRRVVKAVVEVGFVVGDPHERGERFDAARVPGALIASLPGYGPSSRSNSA